jgi:hypothetical protein
MKAVGFTTTMYVNPALQMTTLSLGGVTLEVPEDGVIEVPNAAVKELKAHGLSETPFLTKPQKAIREALESATEEEALDALRVKPRFKIGTKKRASA